MILNDTGKKQKRNIIRYLKAINQYNSTEVALLVQDGAFLYQEFIKHYDAAETLTPAHDNYFKLQALSSKNYVNYNNILKQLGVGPMSRKKLNFEEEDNSQDSILNVIAKARE